MQKPKLTNIHIDDYITMEQRMLFVQELANIICNYMKTHNDPCITWHYGQNNIKLPLAQDNGDVITTLTLLPYIFPKSAEYTHSFTFFFGTSLGLIDDESEYGTMRDVLQAITEKGRWKGQLTMMNREMSLRKL